MITIILLIISYLAIGAFISWIAYETSVYITDFSESLAITLFYPIIALYLSIIGLIKITLIFIKEIKKIIKKFEDDNDT